MNELLEGLNEGQKELASMVDGSALAIASAGSGKTTTLTRRIMHMLESDSQCDPHSILCLTFTDAGAVALRQKLLDKMGATAYEITINTFHAFCNDVIQKNLGYFGIEDLETISQLESIGIGESIIDSLSHDHALSRNKGNKYFEVSRMLSLFSIMKRENWRPEFMQEKIKEFVDYLPEHPDFIYKRGNKKKDIEAGDPNERKIGEVSGKLDMLSAAVGLYDIYNERMAQANRYDFNDMIRWVIDAFNDNEDILRDYQERYLYVISDEAQDSSGAQHEIMNLVMNFWEDSNINLIGDINQSVFGFQGANVQNITRFIERYNPKIITMNKNYRSTQGIVDKSINVISKLKQSNLDVASDLEVQGMNESPGEELATRYVSHTHENVAIAHKVKALIDGGVKPAEIFVIYRKHSDSKRLYDHLYDMGIPVNTKRRLNVLDEPIIMQMLSIMEYIASDIKHLRSDKFFEILHYDFAGIPRQQIERILVMKQDNPDLHSLDKRSFRGVNALIKLLDELEGLARNGSVLMFVNHIIYNTGIKDLIINQKDNRKSLALRTFFDFVRDENMKDAKMDLTGFIKLIGQLRSGRISIPMDDVSGDSDGVMFTTAHGSKGLEAEHVFMIRCNRSDWEKARARSSTYYLPETLTFASADDGENELRRLFYVAMTRAKTHLYMSCSEMDDKSKGLEPSLFLVDSEVEIIDEEPCDMFSQIMADLSNDRVEFSPKIEKDRVQAILDKFKMSPTSLNAYLRCPLTFYYERILRVPFMETYPLMYGTLFHRVIEEAKKRIKLGSFDSDAVIQWGYDLLEKKLAINITDSEKSRLRWSLKETFPDFYAKYLMHTSKYSIPEYKVKDVVIEGVPVYGELDDLEFDEGNGVTVTDYKTGKEDSVRKKMKPFEGDVWRQVIFYKLLLENAPRKNWRVKAANIVGVSEDPFTITYQPTTEDVIFVKQQMVDAYKGIMSMQFDGCGDPECKWCNVVK